MIESIVVIRWVSVYRSTNYIFAFFIFNFYPYRFIIITGTIEISSNILRSLLAYMVEPPLLLFEGIEKLRYPSKSIFVLKLLPVLEKFQ